MTPELLLRSIDDTSLWPAGDVVTTGTWTDAWPVRGSECWYAEFDSPLAPLAVRFV